MKCTTITTTTKRIIILNHIPIIIRILRPCIDMDMATEEEEGDTDPGKLICRA